MPTVDVDLRLVDLTAADDAVARAESSLTAAEVARARRGTPDVHRRRVLLSAALRAALAPDLDVDPRERASRPRPQPAVPTWPWRAPAST